MAVVFLAGVVLWALRLRRADDPDFAALSLLGGTFLLIQINEYIHLGFTPQDQAFGSAFYTLTGFHGLHVFVGLTLLTLCYIRVKRVHDFTPQWSTPLQASSLYWHFVDVVWVLLYILVYLV